jgi:adenylate kinase family enzyme
MNKEKILLEALRRIIINNSEKGVYGLVLIGLPKIPLIQLLNSLENVEKYCVSVVGLDEEENSKLLEQAQVEGWGEFTFGTGATHANKVRNEGPEDALNLVFVWQEEERLQSVTKRGYKYIGLNEVIKQICEIGKEKSQPDPWKELWNALMSRKLNAYLTLDGVMNYYSELFSNEENVNDKPRTQLPFLGLLPDRALLTKKYKTKENIIKRLLENIEMVETIQRDEEDDRAKIIQTIRANSENENELKVLQALYNSYLKIAESDFSLELFSTLQNLDISDAQYLLSGKVKQMSVDDTHGQDGNDHTDDDDDSEDGDNVDGFSGDGSDNDDNDNEDGVDIDWSDDDNDNGDDIDIDWSDDDDDDEDGDDIDITGTKGGAKKEERNYQNLTIAAISLFLEGKVETLEEILNKANESLKNGNYNEEIIVTSEDVKVNVKFQPNENAVSIVKDVITPEKYGAVLTDSEAEPDEILSQYGKFKDKNVYYDSVSMKSLLSRLGTAKKRLIEEFQGEELLKDFLEKRTELVGYAEILSIEPLACLLGLSKVRTAVTEYISAYERFMSHLYHHYPTLLRKSGDGTPKIYKEILQIDILKLLARGESSALLMSLNPLYLWKYHEIARVIKEEGTGFTEENANMLLKEIINLPEPLLALALPGDINKRNDFYELGFSQRLGMLPFYRSISSEMSDLSRSSIEYAAIKLSALYQPVKNNLRIMLVNPIDTSDVSKSIRRLVDKEGFSKVTLIIAKTVTKIESEAAFDPKLKELIFEGKADIEIVRKKPHQLKGYLEKKPVHILGLSGEKSKAVDLIESEGTTLHPLSIPHRLQLDEIEGTVSLQPQSIGESEGTIKHPFGVYHSMLSEMTGNRLTELTLQERNEQSVEDLSVLLSYSQFVISLGEMSELDLDNGLLRLTQNLALNGDTIYTYHSKRIIKGISKHLENFNYFPTDEGVNRLLSKLQEVGGEGISTAISTKAEDGLSKSEIKGLLGLAVALNWYEGVSQNKRNIVLSLDSPIALKWLHKRDRNLRSDYLGIRQSEDGTYKIDVIEVKAYDATNDDNVLSSHAVEQIKSIADVVTGMVSKKGDLFTDRRRELLRMQIFREALFGKKTFEAEWIEDLNQIIEGDLPVEINQYLLEVIFDENHDINESQFEGLKRIKIGEQGIQRYLGAYVEKNKKSNNTPPKANDDSSSDNTLEKYNEEEQSSVNGSNNGDQVEQISSSDDNLTNNMDNFHSASDEKIIHLNENRKTEEVKELGFEPTEEELLEIKQTARNIYRVLQDLGVNLSEEVDPEKADIGPSIIRYKVKLQTGERVANLQNRSKDLMRELATEKEPIIDNLPNTNYIYIDLPRPIKQTPYFKSILSGLYKKEDFGLSCPIGVTPDGKVEWLDITNLPHMLVAGSTQSGKSMFLYSLIVGLVYLHSNRELQLILIDPKQTDFIDFNDLPHLKGNNVITNPEEAIETLLDLLVTEVEDRTQKLVSGRFKNIKEYNAKHQEDIIPPIVVVIDEFADLVDVMSKSQRDEFDLSLRRLAQRARNVGIHLIVATQRPTTDIINGTIKSNLPCRISFKLTSNTDSRTILDKGGAEHLLGKGDMLASIEGNIKRMQGFFLSSDDIRDIIGSE